ncbi:glycosyltransferase [Candidatus Parcubacteria bacterium]|nr:glycosyltransferase [Patescibacteria group bacterium]MBU4466979.1 glycosyltransferase [Patescibacteria group bacterium]MCG2688072.1 glycosyltransferase [Candidatus Parcubacteria bacterium]
MSEQDVSIVVPVFNEERTVASVARALVKLEPGFELIFVNDGSTDNSQEVLEKFADRIKIISLKRNHGKGFALAIGVKRANGKIIVFLDADLVNLKPEHVERMVMPLLINQAQVVIASISSTSGLFDPLTLFSGQRAYFRKDLFPYLSQMSKTRYGIEVYLNKTLRKKKTKIIKLKDISYVLKKHKMDSSKLPSIYLKEVLDITKTIAQINGMSLKKAKSVYNKEKIKSLKDLLKMIGESEDMMEDLKEVKRYINSYLAKHFKFKNNNENSY